MSLEAASNKNNSHRERDVSRDNPTPDDGDSQSLSNIFGHAFGKTAFPMPGSVPVEQSGTPDDFEATVFTSCLLASVVPVAVPLDFEQQVLERIQSGKALPADAPQPLRSPFQQNPSRELFRRYRRLIQVALPLLLAGSIALAMYISASNSRNDTDAGRDNQPPPSIAAPMPSTLEMHVPASMEFMQFTPIKKKVRKKKDGPVTGY